MPQTRTDTTLYQPDIALFLVIIPLISAFNYYLTYTHIHLNGFLLITFTIDTVQGYLAWWAVRSIILYFDQKWPYEQGLIRRIGLQLVCTTVVGLLIISLSTELVSFLAKGKSAPTHFYLRDLFIIGIWFFVINGIYVGLYFYHQWHLSEASWQAERKIKTEGFLVRSGKTDRRLPFNNLAGFTVDGDYVMVCPFEGGKYYTDQSLDKIEQDLPAGFFFRLNRQTLLHRQLVIGFKRADNGGLIALLQPNDHFPLTRTVSRTKAAAFRGWFQAT